MHTRIICLVLLLWCCSAEASGVQNTEPNKKYVVLPADPANKILKRPLFSSAFATDNQRVRVMVLLANPAEADDVNWQDRRTIQKAHPAFKKRQNEVLSRLPQGSYTVRRQFENHAAFSAEISIDALRGLVSDPNVLKIEPVVDLQEHLAQGIPLISGLRFRSTYNGAGIGIAVVDSGVDYNHPNLGGGGFPNSKVIGGYNFGDNTDDPIATAYVLVIGGRTPYSLGGYYATSVNDMYNPAQGTWPRPDQLRAPRYSHSATLLRSGKVLVVGGSGSFTADSTAELYDSFTDLWLPAGNLNNPRPGGHTATLLNDGRVLVVGGGGASAEIYEPSNSTWTLTGSLAVARSGHTATLLQNGKVLVCGGEANQYGRSSAELYDPASGTWTTAGLMNTNHSEHTATLLNNGSVLIAGGFNVSTNEFSAELFNGSTWEAAPPMINPRYFHTATLLKSGAVLVVGGRDPNTLDTTEIFSGGGWQSGASLNLARESHTATLLPNGKVLVVGGWNSTNGNTLDSTELFDPSTGSWTTNQPVPLKRSLHQAVLLPPSSHGSECAGILAGDIAFSGDYIGGVAPSSKLYALKVTPKNSGSASLDNIAAAWDWCITHQYDHAEAPILVISTSFGINRYSSLCDGESPCAATFANHAQAAGITIFCSSGNNGFCDSVSVPACLSGVLAVGAVYDKSFGTVYPCLDQNSCATKGSGKGCPTGYYGTDITAPDRVTSYSNTSTNVALLAPADDCYTTCALGTGNDPTGNYEMHFGGTSAACPYAAGASACLQSAAKVILGRYLLPAEIQNVLRNTGISIVDPKAGLTIPRIDLGNAIASLSGYSGLTNGPLALTIASTNSAAKAFTLFGTVNPEGSPAVAWFEWGDTTNYQYTTSITNLPAVNALLPIDYTLTNLTVGNTYHFRIVATNLHGCATGDDLAFTVPTPPIVLQTARAYHTASMLPDGEVLVAGGDDTNFNALASVEIFNPLNRYWTYAAPLSTARSDHTATVLMNGAILVVGGHDYNYRKLAAAEEYDPTTATWTNVGSLSVARWAHTATLLQSGGVLVTGGEDVNYVPISVSEIYNPTNKTWTTTAPLSVPRKFPTATALSNGTVLVAGGYSDTALASSEVYDPATQTWLPPVPMKTARANHTATLLPNGKVLVAGGFGTNGNLVTTAEVYDSISQTWTSVGDLITARANHTQTTLFDGRTLIAGGDGTNFQTLADVEIFDYAGAQWHTAAPLAVSRDSFTSTALNTGEVLIVGGWNSDIGVLAITELYTTGSPPPVAIAAGISLISNNTVQLSFTNVHGNAFSVFATTNIATPLLDWDLIGTATDSPPGLFRFIDDQATNHSQRFYKIRSP